MRRIIKKIIGILLIVFTISMIIGGICAISINFINAVTNDLLIKSVGWLVLGVFDITYSLFIGAIGINMLFDKILD